jgi:MATE family multidrug resistance protein
LSKNLDKNDNDERKNKNTNYNWTPQCLAIAAPAFVSMLADPVLSLIDTVYVARIGTTELAALGACTSIFSLSFNAFRGTTAATTSLVATELAKAKDTGDTMPAKYVTYISLWFAWWLGISVSAILFLFGQQALAGMGISKQSTLFPAARDYLYTRLWAAPAVLLIGVAEGAFRGYGNAIVPLAASVAASILNIVLDPLLMFTVGWKVKGAAAATAIAQLGATAVYAYNLIRKKMLTSNWKNSLSKDRSKSISKEMDIADQSVSRMKIIRTIVGANVALLAKQGSLLFGWSFATARATRLGADHVAAHQIGLSVWLLFALILDGAAVAAQVLMSRAFVAADRRQVKSLVSYFVKFALLQGFASFIAVDAINLLVPQLFTKDPLIQQHLHKLMPHLAWQQILVSLTLVVEGLAMGANQFRILASGTALSTMVAIWKISQQTSIEGIWELGIVSLFVGRLATAIFACFGSFRKLK